VETQNADNIAKAETKKPGLFDNPGFLLPAMQNNRPKYDNKS